MNSQYWLRFAVLVTFFYGSKQVPLDDIPTSEGLDNQPSKTSTEDIASKKASSTLEDGRRGRQRMLGEPEAPTTLGYEGWWFVTSRRPIISYKDYPGRPGVASWKEIGSASDSKDSKPTAAGVSSDSGTILSSFPLTFFRTSLSFFILPLFWFIVF